MDNEIKVQVPQSVKPPVSIVANMYLLRTGKIFSNLAILTAVLSLSTLVTPLITILYYVVMFLIIIAIIVLTMGTIFATNPELISNLWDSFVNGGEFLRSVMEFLLDSLPYFMTAVAGISLVSLLFLCINKQEKITWRIVVSSLLVVTFAIGAVILFTGGV